MWICHLHMYLETLFGNFCYFWLLATKSFDRLKRCQCYRYLKLRFWVGFFFVQSEQYSLYPWINGDVASYATRHISQSPFQQKQIKQSKSTHALGGRCIFPSTMPRLLYTAWSQLYLPQHHPRNLKSKSAQKPQTPCYTCKEITSKTKFHK